MTYILRSKVYTVKPVNRKDPKRAYLEIRETITPTPGPGKPRYFINEIIDDRMNTYEGRSGPIDEAEFKAMLTLVQRDLNGGPYYRINELEMPWDEDE